MSRKTRTKTKLRVPLPEQHRDYAHDRKPRERGPRDAEQAAELVNAFDGAVIDHMRGIDE